MVFLLPAGRRNTIPASQAVVFENSCSNVIMVCYLVSDHRPVGNGAVMPLFIEFGYTEVQKFNQRFFIWECPLLCHFSETGVNTFHSIGGVHHFPHSAAVVKELLHMLPVTLPDSNGSGIALPVLFKRFKRRSGCLKVNGSVDFFQVGGIFLVIFAGYIL